MPDSTAKIVKILNLSFIDFRAANLGFQNFSISTSTWQRLFEPLSMIMMIIIPCPWREDRTHLTNGRIVCCMGAQDDSLLGYFHLRIYQNLSYKASPRASLSNQISFLPKLSKSVLVHFSRKQSNISKSCADTCRHFLHISSDWNS